MSKPGNCRPVHCHEALNILWADLLMVEWCNIISTIMNQGVVLKSEIACLHVSDSNITLLSLLL